MPNWCQVELTVTPQPGAPASALAAFRDTVKLSDEQPLSFEKILPIPDDVTDHWWCEENWGTKWDAYQPELKADEPHRLIYCFDTAWSPPSPVIEAASAQHPDLEFRLFYDEPGMDFAGLQAWCGGDLTFAEITESVMNVLARLDSAEADEEIEELEETLDALDDIYTLAPRR